MRPKVMKFLYKERTLAAYLSVKKQLTEKLQVQAGLRYEHTLDGKQPAHTGTDTVAVITDASIPRCT